MKKIFLVIISIVMAFCLNAQPYYNVTHLTGMVTTACTDITVNSAGFVGYPSGCSGAPYTEGLTATGMSGTGSYTWNFAPGAAAVRFQMDALEMGDAVTVLVNGVPYYGPMIPYPTTCVYYLPFNMPFVAGGALTNAPGFDGWFQMDITAVGAGVPSINQLTIRCTPGAMGVGHNLSFRPANPAPVAFPVTDNANMCAGDPGSPIRIPGSTIGINYHVLNTTTGIAGPIFPGTGGMIDFGLFNIAGVYKVIGVNAMGCAIDMANTVSIVVNPLPNIFTLISAGTGYCAGSTTGIDFLLTGSQVGVNYQVLKAGVPDGPIVAGTGAFLNLGFHLGAGPWTVRATNAASGCARMMTGAITITIMPLPIIYTVTGGGMACPGAHVYLSNSQAGMHYQLYRGTTPLLPILTGTGASLDFGLQTVAGNYTVVATNGTYNCPVTMTGIAVISSASSPIIYNVTGGGPYCVGGTGVVIGVSNSQIGVTYRLFKFPSTTPVASIAGTGSAISFGLITAAGLYTVTGTNTSTGCVSNMSGSATVTVNPLPIAYYVTGGGAYCSGGTGLPVGVSSSTTGVKYQLYYGSSPVGVPVNGLTGTSISFPNQFLAGTYKVLATNTTTGCTNWMIGSVTISINPSPAPIGGPSTVCVGSSITLTDVTPGGTWTSISDGLKTLGSGTGILGGLATGTTIVTYKLVGTGCFTVAPIVINPTPGPITGPATVCASAPVHLSDPIPFGHFSSTSPYCTTTPAGVVTQSGYVAGTAIITYTLPAGCSTTFSIFCNPGCRIAPNATGIADPNDFKGAINIYPNPTMGNFNLQSKVDGLFTLLSIDGKQLATYNVTAGVNELSLPNGLAVGLYLGKFLSVDGIVETVRITYEH